MISEKSSKSFSRPLLNNRLNWIVLGGLITGILFVTVPIILRSSFGEPISHFLKVVYGLLEAFGEAALVATFVGFSFEILLSQERADQLKELLDKIKHFEEFGFKTIYASRQQIFDEILHEKLLETKNELRIMGICVSLFKESERTTVNKPRLEPDQVIDALASLAFKGCKIQVLFLQRYPSKEQLRLYGNETLDLYYMREHDEDEAHMFRRGKRLKIIANRSLGDWIMVLLKIAEKTRNLPLNDRRAALQRLEIREYLALPSVSIYILDDEIYVTPYLFRRHCSDVPGFKAGDKKTLYREYYGHFVQTWNDPLTRSAIDPEFVEMLVNSPDSTLQEFEKRLGETTNRIQQLNDRETPEHWQEIESTIKAIVERSRAASHQ